MICIELFALGLALWSVATFGPCAVLVVLPLCKSTAPLLQKEWRGRPDPPTNTTPDILQKNRHQDPTLTVQAFGMGSAISRKVFPTDSNKAFSLADYPSLCAQGLITVSLVIYMLKPLGKEDRITI